MNNEPKKPRTWITRVPGEKGIKKRVDIRLYDVDKTAIIEAFKGLQKGIDHLAIIAHEMNKQNTKKNKRTRKTN